MPRGALTGERTIVSAVRVEGASRLHRRARGFRATAFTSVRVPLAQRTVGQHRLVANSRVVECTEIDDPARLESAYASALGPFRLPRTARLRSIQAVVAC